MYTQYEYKIIKSVTYTCSGVAVMFPHIFKVIYLFLNNFPKQRFQYYDDNVT